MTSDKAQKPGPEAGKPATAQPGDAGRTTEQDIGATLRAAYESAVNEAIPPEMLDLLAQLR